jgi:hypothetical protein
MRTARPWLPFVSGAASIVGCSFGSLTGFSGGADEDASASVAADAASPEGGDGGAGTGTAQSSCAEIKRQKPDATDGMYLIDPDGPGVNAAFEVFCDMTSDGGGWMLVTEDMLGEQKDQNVTVVRSRDERGGALLAVFANSFGCGSGQPSAGVSLIRDVIPWTKLRARYVFRGAATCWAILGGRADDFVFSANVVPFERGVDVARDAVRMGGSAGDAFAGDSYRCDDLTTNFWHGTHGAVSRSIVAIIRRESEFAPAGLATFVSCADVSAGTTSPTNWEYRDVFLR